MITTANDSLLLLLGVLSGVLGVVVYIWTALALAGLFRKTGDAPWSAWVPFLNVGVVLRLGGFSPWLVLLAFVPGLGAVAVYVLVVVSAHRIGRDFGVGAGMTVLAAVLFVVWASILGLGPAVWSRRPVETEAPPWATRPPMSEFTPLLSARADEPGARRALAEPGEQARPLPPSPSAAPVATGPVVRGDLAPTEFRPSPWAPPEPASPFAPPAPREEAPAAAAASDDRGASAGAPRSSAADAAPARTPADRVAHPDTQPLTAASAEPAGGAPVDSAPVDSAAEDAVIRRRPAAAPDPGDDDDQWPSEIDDVSAISASPSFPPSAASTRPGVVPSLADPDAEPRSAARRTWDAVPAASTPRRAFATAPDEFPELSEEVSAVIGAPAAGAPRTAHAAVPAQLRRVEEQSPDGDLPPSGGFAALGHAAPAEDEVPSGGGVDHTVVVARRRPAWQLVTAEGVVVPLTSTVVVLGRQPIGDPAFPGAQLVALEDRTRTVSKTHARLELRSDLWHITDLRSTNGVVLMTFLGAEIELEPGSDAPAGERFLLGDAEVRLERPGR